MVYTDWSCKTRLSSASHSASSARSFVGDSLVEHNALDHDDSLRLAVSELATNAFLHAGTDFTVTLSRLGDTILLEVEDGIQDDVPGLTGMAAARQVRAPAAGISGRGLELVSLLSQDWGVKSNRPGHKTVWASFEAKAA